IPPPPLGYTIGSPIPAVPVDALDPNAQWSGYIPYTALPAVTNPSAGFLATANARISPDDYPYAIALNWAAPYRVERITHILADSTGLTPADMLRIEMDVHSELDLDLAQRFAYALDHTTDKSHNTARLHEAADILRAWNGDVSVDAAAPAIVAATRAELWPMLLVPQITAHDRAGAAQKNTTPEGIAHLYNWAEQGFVLEQLVLHQPARWLPSGTANWNDLLATAVDRGLTTAHAPANLRTWSYSKTHPIELDHPLLSNPFLARLLGITPGSGPRVVPGDGSTIKATGRSFGPSERFTADLANPAATTSNITTGESGNAVSPWYLDQLPHWLAGTTLPLPLHNVAVAHTLTLQP
ncbi:MAG TPA: penicillin acylase family protein, partial [Acidobacteriaceae bacterium]|nr:penicillin acylase family protein [Acidobacteriaceae bacterium]